MDERRESITLHRNSSIELLRIISMLGVVVLHYNYGNIGGGFKYVTPESTNQYYLLFTENLFICAVNVFVIISAYYLSSTQKRSFSKVFEIIFQFILFALIFYGLDIVKGEKIFSLRELLYNMLPLDYFVVLYSVLYIVSPYINLAINRLSEKQFRKMVILMFVIFSVWSFGVDVLNNVFEKSVNHASPIGIQGSQGGYTIINFILVYVIGAYIRKSGTKMSSKKASLYFVVILVLLYALSIYAHKSDWGDTLFWKYNNPLVIMASALVLIVFLGFRYESKIINELARGVFTCYVSHKILLEYFDIEKAVNQNLGILFLHQLSTALIIYFISYLFHITYRVCSSIFLTSIRPLCDKINISLDYKKPGADC